MAKSLLLCCVILLCYTSSASAECRIVEYPDHNEVICTDEIQKSASSRQDNKDKTKRKKELETYSSMNKSNRDILFLKIKSEKNIDLRYQYAMDYDRLLNEYIDYEKEYLELITTDQLKLEQAKSSLLNIKKSFEVLKQEILNEYYKSANPLAKVSGLNAYMTSTGVIAGYYSIKADFDNLDTQPHEVTAQIQALDFNGHSVETIYLTANLGNKQTKTVAKETIIMLDKASSISRWEITDIKIR